MSANRFFMGIFVAIAATAFSGCSDSKTPAAEQAEADAPAAEADVAVADVEKATVAEPVAAVADNSVSVMVDNEPAVSRAEVDSVVDRYFEANGQMIPPEQVPEVMAQIRSSVIDQLTLRYLLDREAKKEGFEVSDAERDEQFAQISGGVSMEDAAAGSGMTVGKFGEMLTAKFRINKLLKSKVENLPEISEKEAKAKFQEMLESNPEVAMTPESVSASHILVSIDEDTNEEQAKLKIDDIYQMLVQADGTNFVALAEELSDCPSGKSAGGSLGTFGRGRMVKEFEDAAFSQEIGVIGAPIKSQFGYHIVRVDDKKEGAPVKFEDVKEMLEMGLKRERDDKVLGGFFKSLRDVAKIENLESAVYSAPVMAVPVTEDEAASAVEAAEESVADVAEAAEEKAGAAVEAAEESVADVAEAAEEKAGAAVEAAEESVADVAEAAEEKAGAAVEAAEEAVADAAEVVEEKTDAVVEAAEEAVADAAEVVEEKTDAVVEAAEEAVADAAEVVEEKTDAVVEATDEAVSDAAEVVEAKTAEAVETTEDTIADAAEAVEEKAEAPAPAESVDAAE